LVKIVSLTCKAQRKFQPCNPEFLLKKEFRVFVELPHHQGGLDITPFFARFGNSNFYSVTDHMVSWLGSLPHASEWVVGQLADPNTWNCLSLTTLKQLHDKLLTYYNCTEWAPSRLLMLLHLTLLHRDATTTMLAFFPFLPLTFSAG
jgi:hypothetical protein